MSEAERERNRRENLALSQADEAAWIGPKPVWHLSFVDPVVAASIPLSEQRPMGPSWQGAVIVEAVGVIGAVGAAWACGANPGGEVQALGPFEPGVVDRKWMYRLLTREDVALMEEEMT